jgi:hypothetical protein
VCLSVYPSIVAMQRIGKHVPTATSTRNNRRIVGRVVLYAVRVVSKENLWDMCNPLSLLGNGLVNTFPRQRNVVAGVVFYTIRDVSNESRRLVLPTISCNITLSYTTRSPKRSLFFSYVTKSLYVCSSISSSLIR